MIKVNIRPMKCGGGFLFTRANEVFGCTHGFIEIGKNTDFTLKVWSGAVRGYGIKLSKDRSHSYAEVI